MIRIEGVMAISSIALLISIILTLIFPGNILIGLIYILSAIILAISVLWYLFRKEGASLRRPS